MGQEFHSIEQVEQLLAEQRYIADRNLATAVFLSLKMEKPLFLEGEAGVGKTEVAKVLASALGRPLLRLQCYEGLDVGSAVYEWNYSRQILHIRMQEAAGTPPSEDDIFAPNFLLKRPLLQAVDGEFTTPPVLLIDELDRADEEFEAFLLELLSDFQITIPEIGTIRARRKPTVVITSNRTREIHDALKRRCLYFWIDYPDFEKELRIIRTKAPQASAMLAEKVVGFVQALRKEDLYKRPGVAESLDWATALVTLNETQLSEEIIERTLGVLLKNREDIECLNRDVASRILAQLAERRP